MRLKLPTAVLLSLLLGWVPAASLAKPSHKKGKKPVHASPAQAQPTPVPEIPMSQDPALKDLKALFALNLRKSHDDAFTDPAVGGLAVVPLRVNVSSPEGGP